MSAGCVRWMLSHAVRNVCGGSPALRTPASRFPVCRERYNIVAASGRWTPFCTEVQDTEQTPAPKKKQGPRTQGSITSVGRKILHRQIQVISDSGEDLGAMHRADVIRVIDEQGLKLVLVNEDKDPPVYQLMSGKQIHEEQMKEREKKKGKATPTQVKELSFSTSITSHDLTTKLKLVASWLEKKHHVRITLQSGRKQQAANLDATLGQMVEQMEVMVGFVSAPKVIREGKSAMCILRQPSAKELSKKGKSKAAEPQPAAQSKTTDNSMDTTEGSIQQGGDENKNL